jgi:hypothetical protein
MALVIRIRVNNASLLVRNISYPKIVIGSLG